jgi:hypothetical protein
MGSSPIRDFDVLLGVTMNHNPQRRGDQKNRVRLEVLEEIPQSQFPGLAFCAQVTCAPFLSRSSFINHDCRSSQFRLSFSPVHVVSHGTRRSP